MQVCSFSITYVLQVHLVFGLIFPLQMNETVAHLFQNQMPSFGHLLLYAGL